MTREQKLYKECIKAQNEHERCSKALRRRKKNNELYHPLGTKRRQIHVKKEEEAWRNLSRLIERYLKAADNKNKT